MLVIHHCTGVRLERDLFWRTIGPQAELEEYVRRRLLEKEVDSVPNLSGRPDSST